MLYGTTHVVINTTLSRNHLFGENNAMSHCIHTRSAKTRLLHQMSYNTCPSHFRCTLWYPVCDLRRLHRYRLRGDSTNSQTVSLDKNDGNICLLRKRDRGRDTFGPSFSSLGVMGVVWCGGVVGCACVCACLPILCKDNDADTVFPLCQITEGKV
jgi:hypothetical protein